jgi:DNA-binding NtrC family response regulator
MGDIVKVLFVDDDPNLLSGVRRALRHEPISILVADGAAVALGLLVSESVDIVVTDDRMPGMSGTEFLRLMRKEQPHILRILMTGHADFETAMRAINEGEVFRFLTKPCSLSDLLRALHSAMDQRELILENQRLVDLLRRRHADVRQLSGSIRDRTVAREADGAIDLGDVFEDLSSIVAEMEQEVEASEERVTRHEMRRNRTSKDREAA